MLSQSDYNTIGIVAKHCDNQKLTVAETEARKFDLASLYCDFWTDLWDIWNEVVNYQTALAVCEANPDCDTPPAIPTDYTLKLNLIEGGEYTNCQSKVRTHDGVRNVLAYYSYSRYTIINSINDTPTGLVNKNNDFSTQIPLKEREMLADHYRTMGRITFEGTLKFLCANKITFDTFNAKDCGCSCTCSEDGCGTTRAKGYGLKSSNITRRI